MSGSVLRLCDLSSKALSRILELAEAPALPRLLEGRGVALLFEHPSARTRNAAEMAAFQLGGHPVTIRGEEVGLDRRESVEDIARTLGCYHALIGARVAAHRTLERMSESLEESGFPVPVVNLLSDEAHPTQAIADLLTIKQCFGRLEGITVAFIGDANNVARSLAEALALTGASLRVASPAGFELEPADVEHVHALGGELVLLSSPQEAASGADVLYTDVWVSMGEEADAEVKRQAFAGYTIDQALLDLAASEAVVLHCLPAHRGEEISADVLEGPRNRVWQQAENRLHAMRGLFAHLADSAENPM